MNRDCASPPKSYGVSLHQWSFVAPWLLTSPNGLPLDELASLLAALANSKQVRSTGIENLLQSKEIKKVFMTEQERLLMETAIAYYRDFEL